MSAEQLQPPQEPGIKEVFNFASLTENEFHNLFLKVSGVNFLKTDSESFLQTLRKAKDEGKLGNLHRASGEIALYCHSGMIRSKDYGYLLNYLGFVFSDKSTVRGGSLKRLEDKVSVVNNKVCIDGKPTDTVYLFINPDSELDMASLFPVLKKIASQTTETTKPLTMVLIATIDVTGSAEPVTSEQIREVFPEMEPPQSFTKPW
jgi:hypothetical protein